MTDDTRFRPGQIVTVFRSRLRDGVGHDYDPAASAMLAAAGQAAGFVDAKTFSAEDGERVTVVTFATAGDHEAWRDDPRHRRAQRRGRDEFYAAYSIQVGECTRAVHWTGGR